MRRLFGLATVLFALPADAVTIVVARGRSIPLSGGLLSHDAQMPTRSHP